MRAFGTVVFAVVLGLGLFGAELAVNNMTEAQTNEEAVTTALMAFALGGPTLLIAYNSLAVASNRPQDVRGYF